MTSEFVSGIPLRDIAAMKSTGLNPADVAKALNRSFSHQIFSTGCIYLSAHSFQAQLTFTDPSMKNLVVEKAKDGSPRIYLMGNSPFLELDDEFRYEQSIAKRLNNLG